MTGTILLLFRKHPVPWHDVGGPTTLVGAGGGRRMHPVGNLRAGAGAAAVQRIPGPSTAVLTQRQCVVAERNSVSSLHETVKPTEHITQCAGRGVGQALQPQSGEVPGAEDPDPALPGERRLKETAGPRKASALPGGLQKRNTDYLVSEADGPPSTEARGAC